MKKPLLLVNILLILGIWSEKVFLFSLPSVLIIFFSSFSLIVIFFVLKKRTVAALLCFVLIWALGVLLLYPYNNPVFSENHVVNYCGRSDISAEGIIYKAPVVISGKTRLYVNAEKIYTATYCMRTEGKIRLTIGSSDRKFHYGDRIRFSARFNRPENFSNPGGFDYIRYLAYRGVFTAAFVSDDKGIILINSNNGNSFIEYVEKYRDRVRAAIEKQIQGDSQYVLRALILGEKDSLPDNIREQFRKLGLSHLLAISGLHVGIVSLISFFAFLWAMKLYPRVFLYVDGFRLALFLSLFPMLFYCVTAGFHMPTIRAACMVGAYTAALLIGRHSGALNNLLLACFIIIILIPTAVFDVSFQLSFAAVLSIILLIPPIQKCFKLSGDDYLPLRLRNFFLTGFFASAAAIIGTAPVIAFHFHRISMLGFLTNIAAVPFAGFLIVPTGLIAALLVPISEYIASLFFSFAGSLTDIFLYLGEKGAKIPFGDIDVTTPGLCEIALYYILVLSLPFVIKGGKIKILFTVILLFAVLEGAFLYYISRGTGELNVTFLDVGRGDSALVEFPEGSVMLIDAGGSLYDDFDFGMRVVAPVLYKKRIKKVDYMVASHPHIDHFGGLVTLMENFPVGELWINCDRQDVLKYIKLLKNARKKGVGILVCSQETEPLYIDGVRVDFFNPEQSSSCFSSNHVEINNRSIVLKLQYGYISYLFTGDIEAQTEFRLIEEKPDIRAAVLKVPHHGSQSSSTEVFIKEVSPEIAVISGRPRGEKAINSLDEVIDGYMISGAAVYKTYSDGAVSIKTDGKELKVETYIDRFYKPPEPVYSTIKLTND